MKKLFGPVIALCIAAAPALAEDQVITRSYDGSYEDALFSLENAIVNRGLVIDHRSSVGDMLERTRADIGGEKIFDSADVFLFCSAQISRQVMETDPANIAYCPYGIFVTNRDGEIEIGYRSYPDESMDAVEELLDEIVADATAF
ncbi:DUF302 domain-containing protein [Pontibaca salina]|uniref:DUF302 domain-containing protein n=1 Tax=Pontibaca salina TaxID=2795731 RepID=A0A934M1X8_9RHOB|nr:DUF302 domain-containing protein [Pontibaca salina]MBI6630086.1 DUF302 domain-containing protein [Pontibaca salina]